MEEILAGMMRTATPVLLAALGGLICEKVGVFTIALEGMMLFGAFFGILGVYMTGSVSVAVLCAISVGTLIGLIYVFFVEGIKANATIVSIGVNTLAVGVTTYLMKIIFGDGGSVGKGSIHGLPRFNIPVLAEIPFLGKMLSGHTILVYIAIFLVAIIHFVIFHTYIGINMRAVGEKEIAATAAGVSVIKYRVIGVGIAGMLCGLAGVHLSLGYVTMFTENMTGGRGFFAYTAVVFGKANPIMVMIASFVFGFAEIATYNAQQLGFPTPLVLCLPYVVTLIALIIRNVDYKNLRPLMKDK